MPNYNKAQFVAEAIQSVLQQSLKDFEFIIVDDGSTDGSLDVIRDVTKNDGRVKVLSNGANRGVSFTINKGMREVTGKYVCLIGSDDLFRPERLERMVNALGGRLDLIAYTDLFLIDESGRTTRSSFLGSKKLPPEGYAYPHLLSNWIWGLATMMTSASAIQEIGYFNESLTWGEDLDYVLRLAEKYEVILVREPLYGYRSDKNSLTSMTSIKLKGEAYCRILESNLRRNWDNLDDRTRFETIRRIQAAAVESHVRGEYLRWWANPTFLRIAAQKLARNIAEAGQRHREASPQEA
jgi:glycosyltransferase involved in cell wall biosynthesis